MAVTRLKRKGKRNKRAVRLLKQRIKNFTDVEIKDRSIKPKSKHLIENLQILSELETELQKTA